MVEAVLISIGILLLILVGIVVWKLSIIMLRSLIEFFIYYFPTILALVAGIFIANSSLVIGVIIIVGGVLMNFIPKWKIIRDNTYNRIMKRLPHDI